MYRAKDKLSRPSSQHLTFVLIVSMFRFGSGLFGAGYLSVLGTVTVFFLGAGVLGQGWMDGWRFMIAFGWEAL